MKTEKTSVTQKYQTTIPKSIRKVLGVKSGEGVEWHVVRSMVVLHKKKPIKDPVKFLTSQVKLDLDAVKLVRRTREEFG
ncbi:MAG: type II toxin-antitoxin system PrlF family antitoxin [Candidatus Aenigmarchaeota archaeon]|nr:type II toxin-antitoxin system PrlF family antitoxin [Candidatus Aenigmarchaeota archaeon]